MNEPLSHCDLIHALHRARLFLVSSPADPRYLQLARRTLEGLSQTDPRLAGLRGAMHDGGDLVGATSRALEILEESEGSGGATAD